MMLKKQREILSEIDAGTIICGVNGDIYSCLRIGKKRGVLPTPMWHVRKPYKTPYGYHEVVIRLAGNRYTRVKVHQVVYLFFCGGYSSTKQINHLDGNKINNSIFNLEAVSCSDNAYHAYRTGLRKVPVGEKHWNAKLNDHKVRQLRRKYASGKYSMRRLAILGGYSQHLIWNVLNKKSWTHVK